MAETKDIAFNFLTDGMDGDMHPSLLSESSCARMVNCQIRKQVPATRPRIRVLPLSGDGADAFRDGNVQGACFYNPSRGQSQQSFGADRSQVVAQVAGKKFSITLGESGANIADVSGGIVADEMWHLAWLYQAENYIISQNGNDKTWIWDGTNDPSESTGIDIHDRENSKLANRATVGIYAHGRIVQVVEGGRIIVGDFLHKSDQSSASNILETTEQQYLATGAYFSAPSDLGNCLSAAILPLRNTQHGHGDVILHYENGAISLDITHPDREEWSSRVITRHVTLDTAARGPYAIAPYDGDQVFRSRHGIQTLRSAAADAQVDGNPLSPISSPVATWLDKDHEPYVRFTSLSKSHTHRRTYCTVAPWVRGQHRGSRGIVVRNNQVAGSHRLPAAWEGLWTFPAEVAYPIQIINGLFNERDRTLVLARGTDGKNRIFEITNETGDDILEDGSRSPISAQLITRNHVAGNFFGNKDFTKGTLFTSEVRGDLSYGAWLRNDQTRTWGEWRQGLVTGEPCDEPLLSGEPADVEIPLGDVPKEVSKSRKLDILLRWRGNASIEGTRVRRTLGDPEEDSFRCEDHTYPACRSVNIYDDFEYISNTDRWEEPMEKTDPNPLFDGEPVTNTHQSEPVPANANAMELNGAEEWGDAHCKPFRRLLNGGEEIEFNQ